MRTRYTLTTFRPVTTLLTGVVIFIALPIVGWGVTDFGTFVGDPARLSYLVLTFVLQVFVVIRFPDVGQSRGRGRKTVRRQQVAVVMMQAIGLAIVAGAPYCDRRDIAVFHEAATIRVVGLGLFVIGFILMLWAEISLGRQFSVRVELQEGHELITDGLYRYVRHPRYLGVMVFDVGIALVFRSWFGLAMVAVLALVLLWRIHDEEVLLHREFGDRWEGYSKKSWHIIPFVY